MLFTVRVEIVTPPVSGAGSAPTFAFCQTPTVSATTTVAEIEIPIGETESPSRFLSKGQRFFERICPGTRRGFLFQFEFGRRAAYVMTDPFTYLCWESSISSQLRSAI